MTRSEVMNYIRDTFSTDPDYPWADEPAYAVYRHPDNKKWFALIMNVSRNKLGLPGEEGIDIINVKSNPILAGSFRAEKGIFPAWHMNKNHWLTVALDGTATDENICTLLELSYELTKTKPKAKKKRPDGISAASGEQLL